MITVTREPRLIRITGHAKGAPVGYNIVCAAVSGITLTLVEGLGKVAKVKVAADLSPGNSSIRWSKENDIVRALVDTYFLGIEGIRDSYGQIKIVEALTTS